MDEDYYSNECYLYPKACRKIAKEQVMPSDAEVRFIKYEYGIDIDQPVRPLQFATIRDQKMAWKALNYLAYFRNYLKEGMGTYNNVVHYKETWYLVNT